MINNENKLFYFFWAVGSLGLLIIALFTNGTGGGGDSVLHYLFAKYAYQHPQNLLNHWAKPFFTLLASPFTIMGFTGIKLFNVICSSASVWFAYKLLKFWNTKTSWALAPILFSTTLFVTVTLSGLTEPLSALILTSAIYFVSKQKMVIGLVIVSFMPFVRSEGLIILGVFLFYLAIKRYFKYIPFLLAGHVIYAIAGYPYYQDIFWIFTKIPYADQSTRYGSGEWEHFLVQLNFQTGPLTYILFWLGCISTFVKIIFYNKSTKIEKGFSEKFWLVYGCFFAFLAAHTSFWALGIFNSMGLVRVFVSVMPLLVIICVDGLNLINLPKYNARLSKLPILLTSLIVAIIVYIPFTNGKYQYNIPSDFILSKEQKIIHDNLKPEIVEKWSNNTIVFTDPNIPYILNLDPFDGVKCEWYYNLQHPSMLSDKKILIADIWFSKTEWGHSVESMLQDSSLKLESCFPKTDPIYYVFSKR
jgi:hypothetical protein